MYRFSHLISPKSEIHIRKILLESCDTKVHNRIVYAMAGIPAAGKTTYVNKAKEEGRFPMNAFTLNPDNVMEAIPEYRSMYLSNGAIAAFEKWQMPAREIAYALLEEAIVLRPHIIIDMGAALPEHYGLLERLKNQEDFKISMYWMNTPIETALARAALRERYTPEEMIRARRSFTRTTDPEISGVGRRFY